MIRCLRLNPMWQADQVLASRAALHGVDAAIPNPQQAALDERARKAALRNKVYKLRDKVWTASRDDLRKRLSQLSLEGEPELAALADRLRVIVDARAKLPQLTEHRDFDGDFFECFQKVLTGSVRQSAEMRERVAASFQDRRLKKRGLRMIKLLREKVPELTAMEEPWFKLLKSRCGSVSGMFVVDTNVSTFSRAWIGVAIVLIFQLFYRLAKLLVEVE